MDQLPAEVAQLKALVPSNSHIMMDVQFHWTNLWWAGKKKNWPLAQYYFNETRGHIQWLIRKSPVMKSQLDQKDVDIAGIFDGVDTSSLAAVKTAIEHKDSARVRIHLQDDARKLLRVPQERRAAVSPADDPDAPDSGHPQHGSGRDVAGMTLRAVALA